MRTTRLNRICVLIFGSILFLQYEALAQTDPNLQASAGCLVDCLFAGNSRPSDALRGLEKIPILPSLVKVNDFGDHKYIPVKRDVVTQFGPVGELHREVKMPNGSIGDDFGSAVIVSPCYILTNAHMVYGSDTYPVEGKDYSMDFRAGVGDDEGFFGSTTAHPVLFGDYSRSSKNDWALMRLDKCAGTAPKIGWAEASGKSATQLRANQPIAMAGMSRDKRGELNLSIGNFTGTDSKTDLLKASSSAKHRESGGGVFTKENGITTLAGLIVGAIQDRNDEKIESYDRYSDSHANLFLSTFEILNRSDVRQALDADKARYGKQNPALDSLTRPLPSNPIQTASASQTT